MIARLVPWLALACALAALAAVAFYHLWQSADDRADRFEGAYISEKANVVIVERVVEVEKLVVERVPVIQRNLEQLCRGAASGSAPSPHDAAGAEAGDVQAGGIRPLGSEIADSLQELERLVGLQEWASREAARCVPQD